MKNTLLEHTNLAEAITKAAVEYLDVNFDIQFKDEYGIPEGMEESVRLAIEEWKKI